MDHSSWKYFRYRYKIVAFEVRKYLEIIFSNPLHFIDEEINTKGDILDITEVVSSTAGNQPRSHNQIQNSFYHIVSFGILQKLICFSPSKPQVL